MINIILATHGEVGEGLLSTLSLFSNETEKINCIKINHGVDVELFKKQLTENIVANDDGDGTLILCDILGGSPCISTVDVMGKMKDSKYTIYSLSGVNFPMLLQAVFGRKEYGKKLDVLAKECYESALEAIKNINDVVFNNGEKEK